MFTTNKYLIYYFNLIEKRRKVPATGTIIERHHIIPKCLGGNNEKENLVSLTGREHYIAHKFLVKITSGFSREKMIHALWGMSNRIKNDIRHNYVSSRNYESARLLYLEIAGMSARGRTYEQIYGKEKANKLKKMRGDSLTKNRKGKTWEQIFGKEKAALLKENMSRKNKNANLGKKLSTETKKKISLSSKGKTYKKISCPICSSIIGSNNIKKHIESRHEENLFIQSS